MSSQSVGKQNLKPCVQTRLLRLFETRVKIVMRLYFFSTQYLFPRQQPALRVVCWHLFVACYQSCCKGSHSAAVDRENKAGHGHRLLFCNKSACSVLLPLKRTYQSGEVAQKTTKSAAEPNTKKLRVWSATSSNALTLERRRRDECLSCVAQTQQATMRPCVKSTVFKQSSPIVAEITRRPRAML